jgi:hypothetical protein
VALLLAAGPARAEVRPEAFLRMLPSLPDAPCGASLAARDAFSRQVGKVRRDLDAERQRRLPAERAADAAVSKAIEKGQSPLAARGGDDPQALKRMTKAQRIQWAMAHAGGASGTGQRRAQAGRAAELNAEMVRLVRDLAEKKERLRVRMNDLQARANADRKTLGGDAERKAFCQRYTSELRTLLEADLGYTHAAVQDLYRIEGLEAEYTRLVLGVVVKREPGGKGLALVDDFYLPAFSHALDYDLP